MAKSQPTFIVGIGGSAGGLAAYKAFLDALSPTTGMAFVIIAHLYPSAHSALAEILSRHTAMPVVLASTDMSIRANHVYVIPSNTDLLIAKGNLFKVVAPRTERNVQIDLFFESLATAMGARAIGVVMSGYNGDGTQGCRHIKARGGVTFAQDMSAEVSHMPQSAKAAGHVDFVMSPNGISKELQKLAGR